MNNNNFKLQTDFTIINSDININDYNNIFIFLKEYNKILDDLNKSYNYNNNKIYNQFIRDYDRCKIYINNKRELDYKLFINYFECFFMYYNYNIYELYIFCTQAIMGICLEIIYNQLKNNQYIGELKKKKSLIYNICCYDDKVYIYITKILRIFKIDDNSNDITLKKIKIKVYIPLYNKNKIIISFKILKK